MSTVRRIVIGLLKKKKTILAFYVERFRSKLSLWKFLFSLLFCSNDTRTLREFRCFGAYECAPNFVRNRQNYASFCVIGYDFIFETIVGNLEINWSK